MTYTLVEKYAGTDKKIYTLLENSEKIIINLNDIKCLFGPDAYRDFYYLKWNVMYHDVLKIYLLENYITSQFAKCSFTSNLIERPGYPLLLSTKYILRKGARRNIITDSELPLQEYMEDYKTDTYNISMALTNIFIDKANTIFYSWELVSITCV
tara:strand:+ start:13012 stop:13473 length:462 start_codon:yes stop_codon:yes gene_type:complete